MDQIFDFITSLDWANNWLTYILASLLIFWFVIITLKYIFNKFIYVIKKVFYLSLLIIIGSLISYTLFLSGVIEFDILSLVGLNDVSNSIVEFFKSISDWFKATFLL